MAILKFITQVNDLDQAHITASTTIANVDTTRVNIGIARALGESFAASWPAPAGSTVWMHWVHSQTTTVTSYDVFNAYEFYDAAGRKVAGIDIYDAIVRLQLFADTTQTLTFASTANAKDVWDLQFVKNGTTSLTMNFYVNGVLKGSTLTAANAADKGVPITLTAIGSDAEGSIIFSEGIIADEDTRGWRLREHAVTSYGVEQGWTGDANAVTDGSNSTGIFSNTNNTRASFGVDKLPNIPVSATIDRVCIASTLIRGASGLANFNHFFRWSGGTIVDDTDVAVATDQREYISEYTVSPDTTLAWTDTELQGIQPGVRART